MTPPLSIVIPSHNRPDLLSACLRSVLRHAPAGVEVLVIDDGSPDAAVSAAAAAFAGVRILRQETSCGFCVSANRGIRAAQAEIVELLNDDTEVTAGWAESALRVFSSPKIAAVAPLVLRWPGGGPLGPTVDSAGDCYFVGGVASKRGTGRSLHPELLRPKPVFGASGSSAFYRRDAFLSVGGFPEEFGAYFEDVDLSFRLHRRGWQVWYEPASRVLHHVGSSHGKPQGALLRQQSRNEERVFWRNLPAAWAPYAVPWHLLVLLGKCARRWREGALAPFLLGRYDAFRELVRQQAVRSGANETAAAATWGLPRRRDWQISMVPWRE